MSGESNNIADWLSRCAGDDEGDDALLDRISLKIAAVWAPRLLNLPAPPTKEDFVKAYAEKGNPNLRGLHYNSLWWIHQDKEDLRSASCAHGWSSHSTSVRAATWEPARRARGSIHAGGADWYILVIIDHATRYMMAKIISTLDAMQTFRTFYRHWVVPFGPPGMVLTDNGNSFRKTFRAKATYQLGCKHLTAAQYRPQAKGINEVSHQELHNVLKAPRQESIRDIELTVDAATRPHNVTPHSAINTSSYEAVFGKLPILDKMQDMTPLSSEQERKQVQQQVLRERMAESLPRDRLLEEDPSTDLQPGDIVVVIRIPPRGVTTSKKNFIHILVTTHKVFPPPSVAN
ncbi:integrase core domain protein [Gregarina niphandrodes]|uniref:Integrase core domain protein n=1 Tax=Gregarina niphandrodes TaxID=110365 RepID=A0A023B2A5_GRENI|nr:integrase core domain protein [Gregarina niphandrodes]EZG48987.1 integrase core domain protein [Gregarina niphandrodes]|eukprot:XP_011132064.1 integrase core domain protein [Gregarina niphandrodes]